MLHSVNMDMKSISVQVKLFLKVDNAISSNLEKWFFEILKRIKKVYKIKGCLVILDVSSRKREYDRIPCNTPF